MVRARIDNIPNFLAGLFFLLLGGAAAAIAYGYKMGTPARMGPGLFPVVVACLLAAVGLAIMIRAIRFDEDAVWRAPVRPILFITAAVAVFALLLQHFGLVVGTMGLVLVSRLTDQPLRLLETILLGLGLAFFAVAMFGYGLRLPLQVWPF